MSVSSKVKRAVAPWMASAMVCMALVGTAHAQGAQDVGAALRRIEAARAAVQTVEADFVQERIMGLFSQALRAEGHLVVQRPQRVRWEIRGDHPGVFVVDGARVAFRAGGSSASANPQQVGPLGAMLVDLSAFLGGALQPLQTRYTFTVHPGPNGSTVLTAVPHDAGLLQVVSEVQLQFSADLRVIEAITLSEPGGDRTQIVVRNVRINSGHVSPSAFTP